MSSFKLAVVGDKELTQIFKVVGMDTFSNIDEVNKDEYALIIDTVGEDAQSYGSSDTLAPLPIRLEVKI